MWERRRDYDNRLRMWCKRRGMLGMKQVNSVIGGVPALSSRDSALQLKLVEVVHIAIRGITCCLLHDVNILLYSWHSDVES